MESIHDNKAMKGLLKDVALRFWEEKGAKFGQRQKVNEIQVDTTKAGYAWLPSKFTQDTEFMCHDAEIEPFRSSWGPDTLIVSLWVYPFKKNGERYQNPIRLTYLTL